MRSPVGMILLLLLVAVTASFGRSDETIEQLIARAEAARPDQQPDLHMQVAQRELKLATEAFKADKLEEFRAAVQQIVKYSDSAHTAALHTGKHAKSTEIKIREIAIRLRDVKLNLDADEQPAVQDAIDRLQGFRTELLHSMFGSKSKDQ
jgi:hypothetical protein